jgi:molybdenum cofactor cytidylyltransferase
MTITIHGVLLAAGRGERFAAHAAGQHKLLTPLPDGTPVVLRALERLQAAVGPAVLAVVRADDDALATLLRAHGATVLPSHDSARGMGASLAAAARALPDGNTLLVALGDMPAIAPATYRAVLGALQAGAAIVQPRCNGLPGHPVGFAARWLPQLRELDGDSGARPLLRAHAAEVTALPIDDAGCLLDIDTPPDLGRLT